MIGSKGQVAMEFFLYSGVFLFMIIVAFIAITYTQSNELPAKEALIAKEVGESITEQINLAVSADRGFNTTTIFPRVILGRPYKISFVQDKNTQNIRFVILEWQSSKGEVSQSYTLAGYNYKFEGCVSPLGTANPTMVSNTCRNSLMLYNNGSNVIINQES
ncbi:MAG: hypothetical protein Q7S22_07620 [Candidatus Micrarchaeota archaeon]|nr:hypothetical protein [Candidatus Micrarchaeota archaeon]